MSGTVANALFATVPDTSLEDVQKELDSANPHVAGFEMPNLSVTVNASVTRQKQTGHNVLAYLPANSHRIRLHAAAFQRRGSQARPQHEAVVGGIARGDA